MTDETAMEAKPETEAIVTAEGVTPMSAVAMAAAKRFGIDLDNLSIPVPYTPAVTNLEGICTQPSSWPGCETESLPMIFLGWKDGTVVGKYPGYAGFIVVEAIHPNVGLFVFTHSKYRVDPETGEEEYLPLSEFVCETLSKGDVFKVGRIKTNSGFYVYRPI